MTVSVISLWLPLVWALFASISWWFIWKKPINHPIVCLIIGFACFFFFAWTIIGYLIVVAIKYGVFDSLKKSAGKENSEDE